MRTLSLTTFTEALPVDGQAIFFVSVDLTADGTYQVEPQLVTAKRVWAEWDQFGPTGQTWPYKGTASGNGLREYVTVDGETPSVRCLWCSADDLYRVAVPKMRT